MNIPRVIFFGFSGMAEFIFAPLVKELTGIRMLETVYTFDELHDIDTATDIDMIVINAMIIGFNMHKQLQTIKLRFPEAYLLCISPHGIASFLGVKMIKYGIDALFTHIYSESEFKRGAAAIQTRRRFVPEYIKQRMHEPEPVKCKGYAFLTDKEHALLVQTMDGLALKEIAANMHIAETTACTVRKNAFRKMGVRSLVDMVKIGVQYNLHSREERAHVVHS